jgi:integrase
MQKSKVPYGQKAPFTVADVERIRASRVLTKSTRDRALFELAICSGLRSCDLLRLTVADVTDPTGAIRSVARLQRQQKTGKPVGFNVSPAAQAALREHIDSNTLAPSAYLFTAIRLHAAKPLTSQAFKTLVRSWADAAGHMDTARFAGHSTRRTLAAHVYSRTRDVASVSKMLGHTSLRHTSDYLGISDDAALAVARSHLI